jgi:hypothetical protein
MNTYKNSRKRAHSRTKAQPELKIALIVLGVSILVLGAVYVVTNRTRQQIAQTNLAYDAADLATERPIQAVHEMGVGPAIPFLSPDGPQPSISLSEETYNFGAIGPTDIVERTFVVRNNGEAPLTISRAYTTCGCTTADISASTIPPGKVATVKLIFDAGFHDTAGQTVRRGLIIENNDPNSSQAEIWVQAEVQSN